MQSWKPVLQGLPFCCSVQVMQTPTHGQYERYLYKATAVPEEDLLRELTNLKIAGAHCVITCISSVQMGTYKLSIDSMIKGGFKLIHKCRSNGYGGGVLYFFAKNLDGDPEDPLKLEVEECKPEAVKEAPRKRKKEV